MSLLTFDLGEVMHEELARQRRPNDFLLHASSHIDTPLRHVQLDVAGAPKQPNDFTSEITLMTGTLWHTWLHDTLRRLGVPYMAEVNLTPWLPEGWAGTADAVIYNPDLKGFVLVDFKTIKGEGVKFVESGGAKEAHKLQASAYWHALKKMGLPLVKQIGVLYIPKNAVRGRDDLGALMVDFEPYPAAKLHKTMEARRKRVQEYRDVVGPFVSPAEPLDAWINDKLAPPSEPGQRVYVDKVSGGHELVLVRDWTADYCPYDVELCDCSTQQKTTKVGYWDVDGSFYHRPGYEHVRPTVFPK